MYCGFIRKKSLLGNTQFNIYGQEDMYVTYHQMVQKNKCVCLCVYPFVKIDRERKGTRK